MLLEFMIDYLISVDIYEKDHSLLLLLLGTDPSPAQATRADLSAMSPARQLPSQSLYIQVGRYASVRMARSSWRSVQLCNYIPTIQ